MSNKLIKFITKEEFDKILKEEKDKRYKLIYALGFCSGLRISEIIGLEKEISRCCESNIKEEKVNINNKRKKYYCSKCGRELNLKDIKRKKGEWAIEPLKPQQVLLQEHQVRIFGGKGEKDRITVTPPMINESHLKLLPLDIPRRTIQDRFSRTAFKVTGKKMSIHTLRHGFGNYMVNDKNMPIPMVQGLMGHSRIDTTGIYTKANPKQAIERAWESF